MNDKRGFDRAVDRWLNDGSDATPPAVIDAVLLAVRNVPQERDFRVPWRTTSMTSYLRVAAVIALVVMASTAAMFTFGPGGSGFGGTSATPSPSAALLARGSFIMGGHIELDASGSGSNVTGSMTFTDRGLEPRGAFTVDLACTRTTDGGLILIGGPIIESTWRAGDYEPDYEPDGTNVAIVLQRGSPVKGTLWTRYPDPDVPSCPAFLETIPDPAVGAQLEPSALEPIEGTIELGP